MVAGQLHSFVNMTIVFTGSRCWPRNRIFIIRRVIRGLPKQCLIIHGGALGADSFVDGIARDLAFDVKVYKADWNRYGKSAGFIRNMQMIDKENPNIVIGFLAEIEVKSKGTRHALRYALSKNISTFVFGLDGQVIPNENFI